VVLRQVHLAKPRQAIAPDAKTRRGKKHPNMPWPASPSWGGWGILLMDNRKEASCVTVAGDRVRPGFL
jgi:hypothetical protein